MTTTPEDIKTYALLSQRVYDRQSTNRGLIPEGWEEINWQRDNSNGFSAGVYWKESSRQLVFSITGTNDSVDWLKGNIPAATGVLWSKQLADAIAFYQTYKSD